MYKMYKMYKMYFFLQNVKIMNIITDYKEMEDKPIEDLSYFDSIGKFKLLT